MPGFLLPVYYLIDDGLLLGRGFAEVNAGICRKVLIFVLVGIGNLVDVYVLGQEGVLRTAVIFFYLSNEGISFLENAGRLGLPIPEKLKDVLEQLHDKGGSDNESA